MANLKILGETSGTPTTGRDIVWATIASGGYPALASVLYFGYRFMRTLNRGSFCEDKEVKKLRKLIMLVAILAMALVVAAPAIAQPNTQEFSERRNTSGAATPKAAISNTGNNANLCPTLLQAAQTGQVLNEQGVTQYLTKSDDLDFVGSQIGLTPEETAQCTQEIRQGAAAGPKAEAKAGAAEAKAGGAAAKALPATGGLAGTASLLGLGAGALLVAGGLLARKMIR